MYSRQAFSREVQAVASTFIHSVPLAWETKKNVSKGRWLIRLLRYESRRTTAVEIVELFIILFKDVICILSVWISVHTPYFHWRHLVVGAWEKFKILS